MRTGLLVAFLLLGAALTMFGGLPETGESAIWSPVEEISTDLGIENQTFPSIAVDGGRVHVVWQDKGDGDADIYHRLFDGSSWQPEEEVSSDTLDESQTGPRVAVAGDEVHVVWADEGDGDEDVYYRHFNGTSWEPEEEVSTDSGDEDNAVPDIAVENGKVHVVWADEGDGDQDIYYRHFNGSSWEPELEISTDAGIENQSLPSIAVENGRIHIVWMDKGDGDWDVYYRLYDGIDWQTEEEVSVGLETEHQMGPRIAVEDGEVHVVWTNSSLAGAVQIYHRHFNGTSWLAEQKVNTETESQYDFQFWPDVAVKTGRAYVVWQDAQEIVGAPYVENDIHLRMLYKNEWTPEVEVSIDAATEMQGHASIAVENGIAHVAWEDWGDGDGDIYYRRGEYFTPPESCAIPPSAYWQTSSPVDIGWTASDDLDLAEVSLFYRYSTDNSSWSEWNLFSTNTSVSGTSSSGTFSFNASDGNGYYEFYSVARDIHDNQELPPQSADAIAGIDIRVQEEQGFLEQYWWTLVLVAIVLIVIVLVGTKLRRRPEPDREVREEEPIQQTGNE